MRTRYGSLPLHLIVDALAWGAVSGTLFASSRPVPPPNPCVEALQSACFEAGGTGGLSSVSYTEDLCVGRCADIPADVMVVCPAAFGHGASR